MQPAPDNSAPATDAMRKQLILAQVQIMELEDLRDELRTELDTARTQLQRNRQLTDSTLQAQEQIESAAREIQEECNRLRASLREARDREVALAARFTQTQTVIAERDRTLRDIHPVLASLRQRIDQLETEHRSLQSSCSWRYTAPLRALGRLFHRRGGRED